MSLRPAAAWGLGAAQLPRPVRILDRAVETPGTVTLRLDTASLPAPWGFAPGQFTMLYAFGVGEVPISCSGDPGADDGLVHTLRAVGAVTRALAALPVGGTLGVRGPFGSAWPLDAAQGQDVVLIAGGLGIAPLRSALYGILRRRARYGRVAMLYGAREPAGLLFAADRAAWASRPDLELRVTVDHADPGWTGPVGVVPALLPRLALDPGRTIVMLCGPETMMRFTVRELEGLGIGAERIYVSLERNMKCAVGFCGHCMLGPAFICRDGPVFRLDRVARLLAVREA